MFPKFIFLFIITGIFESHAGFAQAKFKCGTPLQLPVPLNLIINNNIVNNNKYAIRVQFYLITDALGNNGKTQTQTQTVLDNLNRDFNPRSICFVQKAGGPIKIQDDNIFNNVSLEAHPLAPPGSITLEDLVINYHAADAIDIFLMPEKLTPLPFGALNGRALHIGSTAMMLSGYKNSSFPINPLDIIETHIPAHHMSHCLGLFHTSFHHHGNLMATGIPCAPGNGISYFVKNGYFATVPPAYDANDCIERVHHNDLLTPENCNDCGDYVYDTPADPIDESSNWPNLSGNDCVFTPPANFGYPDCSDNAAYMPDPGIIMAIISEDCSTQHFTIGQGNRMRNIIANNASIFNPVLETCLPCITNLINNCIPGKVDFTNNNPEPQVWLSFNNKYISISHYTNNITDGNNQRDLWSLNKAVTLIEYKVPPVLPSSIDLNLNPASGNLTGFTYELSATVGSCAGSYEFFAYLKECLSTEKIYQKNKEDYYDFMVKSDFQLQGFPNPASGIVNINFSLPKPELVILEIFDETGLRIKSTITKQFYKNQKGLLLLDVSKFTNGIYFCKLTIGKHSEMIKLVKI
jgi:hypothetical protein